jgi:hypothetical protein
MKLTYETGIATVIQFIVLSLLNIANTVNSIISTCQHSASTDCLTNMLSSVIFYLLLVFWFALMAGLGYSAQSKRSKKLCRFLIAAEAATFLVAAYNVKLGIKSNPNALSLFTSLIDLIFCAWVMTLAYRLMKAGPRRVSKHRVREHTHQEKDN